MTCTSCQQKSHPLCLEVNEDMLNIIKTYSWQCMDCKSCAKCSKTHDEVNDQTEFIVMRVVLGEYDVL